MLIVIGTDELADILPDLAGGRPGGWRTRSVPHHAHITNQPIRFTTSVTAQSQQ